MECQLSKHRTNYIYVPEGARRTGSVQFSHGLVEIFHQHSQDRLGKLVDDVLGVCQPHTKDSENTYLYTEV